MHLDALGAQRGCEWKCGDNYYQWRGLCVPCFAYTGGPAPHCHSGPRLQWCTLGASACCIQCAGALPGARQVMRCTLVHLGETDAPWCPQAWTSDPPYFSTCRADCEPLVSYSPYSNATDCLMCDRDLTCALGEYLVECTPRSDAACATCPPLATELLEFGDACQTRCIAGFYADPIAVDRCIPCDLQCELGDAHMTRLAAPGA